MGFQMKFRKTIAVPMMVVLGLGVASATAALSMSDVNAKVAELLKPFNNNLTEMKFSFSSLSVDAVRALDFGFNGVLRKLGTNNELVLDIKNANYSYGDGTKPTIAFDLDLKVDLLKVMDREALNEFAEVMDQMALEMVSDFAEDYGAAATVSFETTEKIVDANGNVESIKAKATAVVDMSKLPATTRLRDVEVQSVSLDIAVNLTGLTAKGDFVMNPAYSAFENGQIGVKEYIDALLADDVAVYDQLVSVFTFVDRAATGIVETTP